MGREWMVAWPEVYIVEAFVESGDNVGWFPLLMRDSEKGAFAALQRVEKDNTFTDFVLKNRRVVKFVREGVVDFPGSIAQTDRATTS